MGELSGDIAPYLNPEYWDGQSLGVGEIRRFKGGGVSLAEGAFAKNAIQSQVDSDSVVHIQTYSRGETFDPSNYRPGTIVICNREYLNGAPVEPDYVSDELRQHALPLRPTFTSPSFGWESLKAGTHVTDEKRSYFSQIRWGVVPKKRNDCLYTVRSEAVFNEQPKLHVAPSQFVRNAAPIVIGETRHWAFAPQNEVLERFNILHVVAFGAAEVQKAKRHFFIFGGKTALGNT